MGQYDFTYEIPSSFATRIIQFLNQRKNGHIIANAFQKCQYEYDDVGLAYYAGLRGDNWNKRALDFTIEGKKNDIELLKRNKGILEEIIEKSLRPNESGFLLRNIDFLEIDVGNSGFLSSDEDRIIADIETAEKVLHDLNMVGERICSNATYNRDSKENEINDYYRDMLGIMGYQEVKDQTRHGVSSNGNNAGEVDLLLSKAGKEIAIIEALKLSSVDTNYISQHIQKAINNYNPLGTATFIIAYVTAADFGGFWERYTNYLVNYQFNLTVKEPVSIRPHPNAATRVARSVLSKDNYDFPVYFLAINIRQ